MIEISLTIFLAVAVWCSGMWWQCDEGFYILQAPEIG